ncbi:MFS transporter [Micromonospora sp. NPDC006766]|uniref:MFS transporter n=1 Tax=Micromonospora sp. NPDC006766 TaxID=3154778 RepID=UPI0033F0DEC5
MALVELLLTAREHGAIDLATGTPSLPAPTPELLVTVDGGLHRPLIPPGLTLDLIEGRDCAGSHKPRETDQKSMTVSYEDEAAQAQRTGVPRRYWVWLAGVTLSLLGSQIMAFAMTWTAAGWGGAFAGTVLTAINLPRVVLLLFGGALADRIGAWHVMITSDVTMAAATVLLGGAVLVLGVQPYLLLAAALIIGVVDAFYLPSSGSMPRRLVSGAGLARAMSARQAIGQLSTFADPSAGGLVVATAGLAAAAFMNAGTFVVMAAILIGLRPRSSATPTPPAAGTRCAARPTVCGSRGPIRCCDRPWVSSPSPRGSCFRCPGC